MLTKKVTVVLIATAALVLDVASAQANVITFGANNSSNSLFSAWVEDSITMTPIFAGSSAGPPHWDLQGANALDNNAAIHRGNAGEKVQFTFTSAFDMQSIDIELISLDLATSLTGTLTSSAGGVVNFSSAGTINVSGALWSNVTFVNLEVPLGNYTCVQGQTDCSAVSFDNFQVRATVPQQLIPEPETYTMLLAGLGLLGFVARRKK